MKTLATRILVGLSLASLLLVGIDWLLQSTELSLWVFGRGGAWTGMVELAGPLASWMGIAFVLLPILAVCAWVLAWRDGSITTRGRDGDLIQLQPEAIERTVCREIRSRVGEVSRIVADARQGRKQAPAVSVYVTVSDDVPVPELRTRIRKETNSVLQHLLGVADVSQVRVVVRDVQGGRRSRGSARPARPPRKPAPPVRKERPSGPAK